MRIVLLFLKSIFKIKKTNYYEDILVLASFAIKYRRISR